MTRDRPRDDHITPSAPDIRPEMPDALRPDLPWDRKWFPRTRGVIRWTHDLGTPAVPDWGGAFTIVHQFQSLDWADGGDEPVPTGAMQAAETQPSWGTPEEHEGGWDLPFGLRLQPSALNRVDISLTDAPWHDPPFGPPPLRRRHLRPPFWEDGIPSDDVAGTYVLPVFALIWHRRV